MSVGHSPNEGERYGISEPARLTRKSHVLLLEVEFGFVLPFDDERLPYSTERAVGSIVARLSRALDGKRANSRAPLAIGRNF
jgi:hypothetical protein